MNIFRKYYQVFVISLSEMFVWKLNFVLWRVRTVMQILLLYFLWSTVFLKEDVVLGYERTQILTYILGVAFLRSFVGSSRSQDVAGEIREGTLTNFLLRPISYFGWWWTRDAADKLMNVAFVSVELFLLWLAFQPPLFFQSNISLLTATILAAFLALVLYFYLSMLLSFSAFWIVEVWGVRFLALVALEFLSGGFFPLDILPQEIFRVLQLTPFPYLAFFPAKIYLGQLTLGEIAKGFLILGAWTALLAWLARRIWMQGLRVYGAERR